MTIKVLVEFQLKPGKRDEFKTTLEAIIEKHGTGLPGYLGSKRYEVVGQPDMLVEIADWESVEQRDAHMKAAMDTGVFAPLMDLLGAPFRATVIRPLP